MSCKAAKCQMKLIQIPASLSPHDYIFIDSRHAQYPKLNPDRIDCFFRSRGNKGFLYPRSAIIYSFISANLFLYLISMASLKQYNYFVILISGGFIQELQIITMIMLHMMMQRVFCFSQSTVGRTAGSSIFCMISHL